MTEGTVVIPQEDLPFTSMDWATLNDILNHLPYETILQNAPSKEISVKLYWVKKSGENKIHNTQIMDVICSPEVKSHLSSIMGIDHYALDQCLCNLFEKGDFISKHLDVDACKEHRYVFMICLNDRFEGGEFIVYNPQNTTPYIYKSERNCFILTRCDLAHAFNKVTKGKRRAVIAYLTTKNN